MNAGDFVDSFAERVFRSAIRNTIANLQAPPGRKPSADLVRASEWFRRLSADDRTMVGWCIADAAHAAAFGALAVIDGARPTGPYRYELIAVENDGAKSIVNPETSEDLHDIFQGLVMLPDGNLEPGDIGAR